MERVMIATIGLLCACGNVEAPAGRLENGARSSTVTLRGEDTDSLRVTRGVVYGRALRRVSADTANWAQVELRLDVYEPAGTDAPGKPAVVCIPGGGFRGSVLAPGKSFLYAQDAMLPFIQQAVARGWVAFSIEYRLEQDHGNAPADWPPPPDGVDPDWYRCLYPALRDGKAALRWVHANASLYSVSEDRIALIGGSAGATLATALGVCDPDDFTGELTPADDPTLADTNLGARSDVRAVVSCWGNTAPIGALERRDGRSRYDRDDAAISIIHGRSDVIVPFAAAETLRDACRDARIAFEFHPFDGGHADWKARIDGQPLPAVAYGFLARHLRLAPR